ncbi:ABC transporter domain-containing protein [Hirsutella rhossiliensis]|uniref:ABC transporter domain-containing protein n=1 Tax=Hirsutella rhossiliensis TaxID=111463 RepID=A0A9P8MYS5_9HYPO|nr:ABC transporter domain-containing protein [Hirsutella rhossiliensis]KAH0963797.1 ABC transporter domain-containing protein [Hirsutella rhossiliensis]
MPCFIDVQDKFGPAVAATCYHGFDFTLLFEDIFLCIVPAAVLAILALIRLRRLFRRRSVFRPSLLYYSKLAVLVALLTVQLLLLVLLCVPGLVPKTRASILAAALVLCVGFLCLALSHLEHLKSVRPSALLSLYFGLTLLLDLVRARTLWAIQGNRPFFIAFSAGLGFKLASLVAVSLENRSGRGPRETAGNVFTRGLFWWLNPLLWRGFWHVLDVESLPAIDPELGTPELHRQLWARWQCWPHKTARALLQLLLSAHKNSVLQGVLPRLALSGFTFAQPFLVTRVINFATAPDGPDRRLDVQVGNGLIVATALIYVGLAVSNANSQHKTYRVIARLRASLVSLIYSKTLGVSIPTAQESSAITLMSADVERSGSGLRFMHEAWASPVELGLGIYLLQRQLGPASAAPGVLFLLCSAAGLRVAASMGRRQRLWLEAIEHRIKVTSDALSSIKEVRMGGLQARVQDQLEDLRNREIKASRPFKNALALIVCLSYTTAAMGPVLSFGIFSLLAKKNNTEPLTADRGFTSLAVFSLLRAPMAMILDAIAGLVASLGAIQRIGEYLATDNKGGDGHDPIVTATRYSAGWDRNRGFILQDITLSVQRGSLTFVVGPVGCGKSTLLLSMLGETPISHGELHTSFVRAAYAGQSPWLISDTIQNNIVGTGGLDKDWYRQVVDACALRDDISRMARGDEEMVDGGGSNLSGGQQARLGVARAVYSRQPVVLLDDVMSGLDARTENTLFSNLLGPQGLLRASGQTTIVATNAVHRLSAADHIIVLSAQGKIVEQGSYEQLHSVSKHGQVDNSERDEPGQALSRPPDMATRRVASLQPPAQPVTGSQRRIGDVTVYKYYVGAVGFWNFALFLFCGAVFVFSLIFPQYLMRWWAQENERQANGKLGFYLGTYLGLAWLAVLGLGAGCLQLVGNMMPRASACFHTALLRTTLNAPLSLFAGSAMGDLVNRFSQDLQLIDMELPLALFNTSIEMLSSVANLLVIAIAAKYLGAALPAVLAVFFVVQKFYLRTARQLRLLDIEAKAPLVSHFLETAAGLAAIRCYGAEADYQRRCMDKLDYSQKPSYLLYCVQRWLNLVLDLIVAGIAVVFITIAIKAKGHIDPGLVGTALVGIINFSVSIKALLENWTNLEMCLGAVSRVRSFALDTKSEHKAGEDQRPPSDWPAQGHIAYKGVTAAWEGKDQPALREISLIVEPGQKLAVCGRTGGAGTITVDGVDLTSVPRQEIRERFICVSQTPFLLTGTVRDNVDPFCVASDKDVLKALDQVQMLDVVQNLGGLDAVIDSGTMSIGQKQLLCLARATLRPGSILILDEATASLDWDTDAIVKQVIRSVFHCHTVIAIAHRVWSIADYDRVAVIVDGRVAEYGPPADILGDLDSAFAQLWRIGAGSETKLEDAVAQQGSGGPGEAACKT